MYILNETAVSVAKRKWSQKDELYVMDKIG